MTRKFENALKAVKPNGPRGEYKIPYDYDMSQKDFVGIYEMMLAGKCWEAIISAFEFGFVMGNRATISRKLKRL